MKISSQIRRNPCHYESGDFIAAKAKSDLSDIWDYALAEWGIDQAEKYVRELRDMMQARPFDSSTCVDIRDVRKGYHKIRSGSHIIFFKLTGNGINVIRILHQGMDFERHF